MKRLVVIFALVCLVLPVAIPRVRVDFDHANDFSRYRTYRWAGPPNADFLNQLMQKRVIGFVEEALAAKRKPVPRADTNTIESMQQMRREDAEVYRSLHSICRGC